MAEGCGAEGGRDEEDEDDDDDDGGDDGVEGEGEGASGAAGPVLLEEGDVALVVAFGAAGATWPVDDDSDDDA